MSKQTFKKFLHFFFFSRDLQGAPGAWNYSFHTLFKIHYKKRNPYSITLKLSTDKRHIKTNSNTKFCMNSINAHNVISTLKIINFKRK